MKYQVSRNGYTYSMERASAFEAIEAAELVPVAGNWARAKEDRQFKLEPGVTRRKVLALTAAVLPFLTTPMYARGGARGELELIWVAVVGDVTRVQLISTKAHPFAELLKVLVRLAALWEACSARQHKRVAISRFRSGKREGELKFTRAHDEAFRAEVRAAVAYNEQIDSDKIGARDMYLRGPASSKRPTVPKSARCTCSLRGKNGASPWGRWSRANIALDNVRFSVASARAGIIIKACTATKNSKTNASHVSYANSRPISLTL